MEAHVFNDFFLRWDFTFQVTKAIKLPTLQETDIF